MSVAARTAVTSLPEYLEATAQRAPERVAAVDSTGRQITYGELDRRARRLAGYLAARGVARGDRVGVVLPKTIDALTAQFAVMRAGAAYVPIDFSAPADRARRILADCAVSAVIVDAAAQGAVPDSEGGLRAIILTGSPNAAAGASLAVPLEEAIAVGGATPLLPSVDDLAYILYTSGSTGIPKGVMLTHRNALSFVEWCSSVFDPNEDDRFSSHAPFHFDLSVLDIYVPIKHGASVYLISDSLGKNPKELARFIARHRLTVWYSTPSILTLLLQFGELQQHDVSSLRLVLFAGEVFPVKHLRELKRQWPKPVYYNLYGPTETNVCTYARIPAEIPADRESPYPIGFACSHCEPLVLDSDGREAPPGDEGLLYISGSSVFQGYWNRPAENAAAFLERDGVRWYNTGDVVRWDAADGFLYLGRRDRMVKRRGYRIELGEIERALYLHPNIREAAVVSIPDAESGVSIVAFVAHREGGTPSIIELKTFCGTKIPAYMNPDRFVFQDRLPTTSTDKIDYQALRRQLLEARVG